MTIISKERSYLAPRKIHQYAGFDAAYYEDLDSIGIDLPSSVLRRMATLHIESGLDAIQPSITTANIPVSIQFLENWLPGFVHVITGVRKIDDLVGISTIGAWGDEEIVQRVLELLGTAVPYGDYTNVPFSSWNSTQEKRTVVRFEEGMRSGLLESERAARIDLDSASSKRDGAALALEIQRNRIGFLGFNSGNNNTYGFLNDPGLLAYFTAATGASGSTLWSRKTFLEINADIRTMLINLRTQSQGVIDPETTDITLALATVVVDYLTVTSDFGISVRKWLTDAFPRVRVVSAPELDSANSGANVGYAYAERIADSSTDDGRTFVQIVPTKFRLCGVSQQTKYYEEDYSNATAGVMCKRPYAVTRITGI